MHTSNSMSDISLRNAGMTTFNAGMDRLLTQKPISYLYFEEIYPVTVPPVANIQQPEERNMGKYQWRVKQIASPCEAGQIDSLFIFSAAFMLGFLILSMSKD